MLAGPSRGCAFGVLAATLVFGAPGIDRASGQELAPFITVYEGTGSAEIAGAIAEYVQKELGVEVRFEALSHGVIHSRVQAEAPNFGADLVTNAGFPLLQQAKEEGWSVAYKSPTWADADAEWADPDGHWWINSRWNFVLVANEPRITEAGLELPKSWDDLLEPHWQGEIVMPSPATSGTAFMMLYSFITEYGLNRNRGEEGGWEFLEALDQNVHHYTRGGNAPTDLVGRGEFMLGITSDEQVLPRLEEGYPITMIIPEEGIGFGMQGAAILAGTDRLETVHKVIDLMGTEEFSKFLAGTAGYTTRFPSAVPALFADQPPKYIPNIDLGWALAERDRILEEWMQRIGREAQE